MIIPAYNEQQSIGSVIEMVKKNVQSADILVINDGSKDDTSSVSKLAGAEVIDLPFNVGIGGAMQTGYLYARQGKYDIAVQVDGDGQHNPAYISKLILPLIGNSADMVIGSRYIVQTDYKSSFFRRTGMLFFSALVKFLTGLKVNDTTSGFRAVNKKTIRYFSEHYPTDYPEVDVLVKLYRKNFRISELPVEMNSRQGGTSSITPLRSIYYVIKVSLSLLIEAVRENNNYGGEPD